MPNSWSKGHIPPASGRQVTEHGPAPPHKGTARILETIISATSCKICLVYTVSENLGIKMYGNWTYVIQNGKIIMYFKKEG